MTTMRVSEILAEAQSSTIPGSLPERLCVACAAALPVTGVGLAFMNDDGPVAIIAATDGPARRLEDLQLVLREGPCVDASITRRPVLQPDLNAIEPTRWPHFVPAAQRAGVAAIFSFPLQVGAVRLGILDLYRDSPGMLDAQQLNDALSYSDAATEVILHLQGQVEGVVLHPELSEGFTYSPAIHQATGMISAQTGAGIHDALLLLRARAYADDRRLIELAEEVVDRRLRWDTKDDQHE